MRETITAILVDGGFYRRRAAKLWGQKDVTAEQRADELYSYCFKHLEDRDGGGTRRNLYRIFYYDCPPIDGFLFNPITGANENFGARDTFKWQTAFFRALVGKRKVAVRKGRLAPTGTGYRLRADVQRDLCARRRTADSLAQGDLVVELGQKGVDVKIGIDIVQLAFQRIANQIVLISGDSDFVPAAKVARREGVDFILDSMGVHIADDLAEHIDGLRTHYRDFTPQHIREAKPRTN